MIETKGDALTVERILFAEGSGTSLEDVMHEGDTADVLQRNLGGVALSVRAVTRDEIVSVIAGILEIGLVDVLAKGWRKFDALTAAARRSLQTDGTTEIVELVDHEIVSSHRPHIDVMVDGRVIAQIDVGVDVTVELHALTAVVTAGRLSALRSGRADVSAILTIEGVEVARATRRVDLQAEVGLGTGIPLITPPDVVTLPPAPPDITV